MRKLIFLFAILICTINFTIAQSLDSTKISTDRPLTIKKTGFQWKNQEYLIAPVAFITYGFSSLASTEVREWNVDIRNEIVEDHPTFHTSADNYLQFSPAVATFALKAAGVKSQNDFFGSIRVYSISTVLMAGTVLAVKKLTGELRPDGSANNSFPSGHTATAFAAAEFMHQEFKKSSPILSYSGYLAAAATGTLRMYNNRHYLGDVIAGAGVGILTTKAAYWINNKVFKSHKRSHHQSF
ncbi:phosphatase PAP2 family protein [Pedobacter sp. SD-b]|uniref:Phosphatase PAP2 family protein n=1 Tax=Pedobacter segetis TaxID=2793069 RepID=A0ABS1BIW8_9SPHI|nr:phosphatase PAP2 family protein [Pedobacter segetis]MBK0382834.1 phosphatase PAP2 family protein [Pedobacter segetis]